MVNPKRWMTVAGLIAAVLVMGCEEDERLAQLAQESAERQARQSEQMAEQSKRVAEASRELVAADAQARAQMIEAHAALQKDLLADKANVDRGRDALEEERREIARERFREPIIAETIGTFGIIIACLLPLVLAGYVLYSANRTETQDGSLCELLIGEITTDEPTLLPAPRAAAPVARLPPEPNGQTAKPDA